MNLPFAFWDSSAIVPICLREDAGHIAEQLFRNWRIAAWWSTPVEIASAISRKVREVNVFAHEADMALDVLSAMSAQWDVILPSDELRLHAQALVREYALRAADALQLAAAMEWRRRSSDDVFISGDQRLLAAAENAGFVIKNTAPGPGMIR